MAAATPTYYLQWQLGVGPSETRLTIVFAALDVRRWKFWRIRAKFSPEARTRSSGYIWQRSVKPLPTFWSVGQPLFDLARLRAGMADMCVARAAWT